MTDNNEGYEFALIEWAHEYNGYQRLASSPKNFWALVEVLDREYERSAKVP